MSIRSMEGKVAIITGGSKGIGRATALRFAHDGAKVVVNYSSGAEAAEEVVKLIGDNAIAVKADASSVEGVAGLVDATLTKFGKIDIVVACAGILKLNELEKVSEAEFDQTFNLNVKGPLFLAQKAAPHMSSGSRIIFFSTTQCTASTVTPNYLTYIASKGAIEQITRAISKDLAPKGVMVNCVAPGPIATDLFLNGKSEQLLKMIAGFSPQNRIGKPEEVADVVQFLCSDASSWVTGQVLRINGGLA